MAFLIHTAVKRYSTVAVDNTKSLQLKLPPGKPPARTRRRGIPFQPEAEESVVLTTVSDLNIAFTIVHPEGMENGLISPTLRWLPRRGAGGDRKAPGPRPQARNPLSAGG